MATREAIDGLATRGLVAVLEPALAERLAALSEQLPVLTNLGRTSWAVPFGIAFLIFGPTRPWLPVGHGLPGRRLRDG